MRDNILNQKSSSQLCCSLWRKKDGRPCLNGNRYRWRVLLYFMQSVAVSVSPYNVSTHSPHSSPSQRANIQISPLRESFSQNWSMFDDGRRSQGGAPDVYSAARYLRQSQHGCFPYLIRFKLKINFQWDYLYVLGDMRWRGRAKLRGDIITSCDCCDAVQTRRCWVRRK